MITIGDYASLRATMPMLLLQDEQSCSDGSANWRVVLLVVVGVGVIDASLYR